VPAWAIRASGTGQVSGVRVVLAWVLSGSIVVDLTRAAVARRLAIRLVGVRCRAASGRGLLPLAGARHGRRSLCVA
jgi:hypothetical protein